MGIGESVLCLIYRELKITAFSKCCSKDCVNPKRLSDLNFIMKKVLGDSVGLLQLKTTSELNSMFDAGVAALNISGYTENDRVRRFGQLSWLTVVRVLRKNSF